jgi:hypothetical protein
MLMEMSMKDNGLMAKLMENTSGTMALCMRESGVKIRSMEEVSMSSQMVENIMESGKKSRVDEKSLLFS